MIVAIHDNINTLRELTQAFAPTVVLTFPHPNRAYEEIMKNSQKDLIKYFIIDRWFYGEDLLNDSIIGAMRKLCPNAKFIGYSSTFGSSGKVKSKYLDYRAGTFEELVRWIAG